MIMVTAVARMIQMTELSTCSGGVPPSLPQSRYPSQEWFGPEQSTMSNNEQSTMSMIIKIIVNATITTFV